MCTAVEEHPDGSENSATDELMWDYEDDDVVITLTRDFLQMGLRDDTEHVLRAWDAHETARGAAAVIDYDCCPPQDSPAPVESRLDAYQRLRALKDGANRTGQRRLAQEIAHLGAVPDVG